VGAGAEEVVLDDDEVGASPPATGTVVALDAGEPATSAPAAGEVVALAAGEPATSAPARAAHAETPSAAVIAAAVATPRVHRFSACIPCLRHIRQVTSG
jgi:hypothetical protein